MPPDVEVVIEGLDDPGVASRVENAVRAAVRDARVEGKWTVAVAASETRGRWDVGIRGPTRRHFLSFAAVVDRVPELVGEHLRKALPNL